MLDWQLQYMFADMLKENTETCLRPFRNSVIYKGLSTITYVCFSAVKCPSEYDRSEPKLKEPQFCILTCSFGNNNNTTNIALTYLPSTQFPSWYRPSIYSWSDTRHIQTLFLWRQLPSPARCCISSQTSVITKSKYRPTWSEHRATLV